jgi:hypothetical protein
VRLISSIDWAGEKVRLVQALRMGWTLVCVLYVFIFGLGVDVGD